MDAHHHDSHWSASRFAKSVEAGEDPFALLERFASSWYAPLTTADGFSPDVLDQAESRIGRPLPRALRRWYSLAGRSAALVGGNGDRLLAPLDLELANGRLDFLWENQGVWSLVVRESDLSTDDPIVFIDDRETLRSIESTVSTLALRWALFSAKFAAPCTASAHIGGLDIARLIAFAPPLPYPAWTLFGPQSTSRSHAADDVIVDLDGADGDYSWAWVGARTVNALERAMKCVDVEWDAYVGTKPYAVWTAEQNRER